MQEVKSMEDGDWTVKKRGRSISVFTLETQPSERTPEAGMSRRTMLVIDTARRPATGMFLLGLNG